VPSLAQQPSGHDVASQAQCPVLVHSWPAGHAAQTAPPAPHESFDSADSGSQPPALQQPAHAVPPHAHIPFEHAPPAPQEPHAAPPVPH
jgi:hypothetical protein